MRGPWSMTTDTLHPYLYNGKEFNHDSTDVDSDGKNVLALGWYDYGARFSDPSVGRFTGVDPLAEKYSPITPFNYVANNPTLLMDKDGKEIINPYEKGTENYKTTQKVLAILSKSNPELYSYLDNHSVQISFFLTDPSDSKVKRHGRTFVNRLFKSSYSNLNVDRVNIAGGVFPASFSISTYNKGRSFIRMAFDRFVSANEAEMFFYDNFLGYEDNNISIYLNPADDQNKMVETAAHEGGHAAYALSNPFSDWVWGILSENEGHDKHNGSGKRASAEQSQANAFLRGLSLSDWERIASEFNKNKK